MNWKMYIILKCWAQNSHKSDPLFNFIFRVAKNLIKSEEESKIQRIIRLPFSNLVILAFG